MNEFFFICSCGCGQRSKSLARDQYMRLSAAQRWYAEGCVPVGAIVIRQLAGGVVVKVDDF